TVPPTNPISRAIATPPAMRRSRRFRRSRRRASRSSGSWGDGDTIALARRNRSLTSTSSIAVTFHLSSKGGPTAGREHADRNRPDPEGLAGLFGGEPQDVREDHRRALARREGSEGTHDGLARFDRRQLILRR